MSRLICTVAFISTVFIQIPAFAEPLVNQLIIYVPFGPAGPTDVAARLVAREFQALGVKPTVKNVPGYTRALATYSTKTQGTRGTTSSVIFVNTALSSAIHRYVEKLAPIGTIMGTRQVLLMSGASNITNLTELKQHGHLPLRVRAPNVAAKVAAAKTFEKVGVPITFVKPKTRDFRASLAQEEVDVVVGAYPTWISGFAAAFKVFEPLASPMTVDYGLLANSTVNRDVVTAVQKLLGKAGSSPRFKDALRKSGFESRSAFGTEFENQIVFVGTEGCDLCTTCDVDDDEYCKTDCNCRK